MKSKNFIFLILSIIIFSFSNQLSAQSILVNGVNIFAPSGLDIETNRKFSKGNEFVSIDAQDGGSAELSARLIKETRLKGFEVWTILDPTIRLGREFHFVVHKGVEPENNNMYLVFSFLYQNGSTYTILSGIDRRMYPDLEETLLKAISNLAQVWDQIVQN